MYSTHHIYLNSVLTTQMGHFTSTFIATRRKLYRYLYSQMPCSVQSLSRWPNSSVQKVHTVNCTTYVHIAIGLALADRDPDWESGSGSRQAKTVSKKRKKIRNFMFKESFVGLRRRLRRFFDQKLFPAFCLKKSWSGNGFSISLHWDLDV